MSANTIKKFQYSVLCGSLLACLPSHAASYTFPGNLPAACSAAGSDNYQCGPLTLAAGDTVGIPSRATITVNGAVTTGANASINAAGQAANLALIVNGIVTLGANNNLNGSITTNSAAINVGASSMLNGALTTNVAGVITIGANSTVLGNLTTASGAINVGARSNIRGAILSTVAGAITVAADATVIGDVATTNQGSIAGAGAITLGANSTVEGAVSTNIGAITTQNASKVTLNILAYDGAITVGANSTVGGSVCTDKTAAITVGANATVGGNVETAHAGAITIGAQASVKGTVTVRQAGARTIGAGATVGSQMIGVTCGLVLDTDGDGISDSVDEFPNDISKASSRWYPSSSTYGTVAYEDNWPVLGDYDLNDIVVRYRSRQILNAQSQVTALEMDVRLDARGGAIQSGFALALPGVAPDRIAKVELTQTKGGIAVPVTRTVQLANVSAEDGGVVFEIFPDALELMPADDSASCLIKGYSNTGQGCPIQDSALFKLTVELISGSSNFPPPPYDPFIFHTVARGTEIHLPGRQPTSRANKALLGTGSDVSTLGANK